MDKIRAGGVGATPLPDCEERCFVIPYGGA